MDRARLDEITETWGYLTPEARNEAWLELTAALEEAWKERDKLAARVRQLEVLLGHIARDEHASATAKQAARAVLRPEGEKLEAIANGVPLGSWPSGDLRRAFVAGAKWWEWHKTNGTMWPSDRALAEEEAERRCSGDALQEKYKRKRPRKGTIPGR